MKGDGFVFIICFLIVVFVGIKGCSNRSELNLKKEEDRGYNTGFSKGQVEAESYYKKKMEQEINNFENKLSTDKVNYENKVSEAYSEGLQQGIETMTKEIEAVIEINEDNKKATKKKSKKNWNEIISKDGE